MNLTKKAKMILAGAGAGIVALGAGIGIWQPWADKAPAPTPPPVQQTQPAAPKPAEKEEEKLTITVGKDKIPCTLFEGDGWSIYVPDGWVVDAFENGGKFMAADGADAPKLEVIRTDGSGYTGTFVSFAPQHLSDDETWLQRTFYTGQAGEGWELLCQADEEAWEDVERIMNAMARTFTAGDAMVFSGVSPLASQPEWQITDQGTVLWMDKDGFSVDEAVKEYITKQMLAWPDEQKACFTGRCRMDDLTWAGSYTCVAEGEYIDVFRTRVWYEVAPGKESEIQLDAEMTLQDGWLSESFASYVAVYHDGSAVKSTEMMQTNLTSPGTPDYLTELLDQTVELTAAQLQQCADWFNKKENNGLLRFAYTDAEQVGPYLDLLLYDLGEPEDTLTAEERAAAEKAGVWMELDVFKLSRTYILDYLREKLGLGDRAEQVLDGSSNLPGIYLEEFDAWFHSHGDTAMQVYSFDRGEFDPSAGSATLYFTLPYLDAAADVPMAVTLGQSDGGWIVVSNEPVK